MLQMSLRHTEFFTGIKFQLYYDMAIKFSMPLLDDDDSVHCAREGVNQYI
jgi:hypothetical protein